ncbi:MAG: uroporphyrinogen-III synthase [Bacteroidales bacterium]|nr:uroporphyrinogen-III synthase [Bacteroidales bacterium]
MKIKKILVSQPEPSEGEKSPYVQLAKKYNIQIDFHKFFKVQGITSKEFRQQRINILDHSAIIFTSRNAVDHFFRIAKDNRVEIPDTMKYFCINEATAYYLQKYVQYRKRKIFHGKQTFADLADLIKKNKNECFLIPCSDISKNDVPNFLEEYGIKYSKAVIYETVANDLSFLNVDEYDLMVFFSPVGIKSLLKNFPDFKQGEILIGAFGATTARAVTEAGMELNINAPTVNCPSMTMAIEDYINNSSKKKATPKKKEIKAPASSGENDNNAA